MYDPLLRAFKEARESLELDDHDEDVALDAMQILLDKIEEQLSFATRVQLKDNRLIATDGCV